MEVEGTVYLGTGNVGINSVSPQATLEVNGTIYGRNNVGIGTAVTKALLDVDGNVYMRGNVGIGTSTIRSLLEVGAGRLMVEAAGNVGINSIAPVARLDVEVTITVLR